MTKKHFVLLCGSQNKQRMMRRLLQSLHHTSRSTKQISMRQLILFDRMLQGSGQTTLPHYTFKCRGAVFSGRYNIILHSLILYQADLAAFGYKNTINK